MAETTVKPGYCFRCDEERPVRRTVAWQDDVCQHCGSTDVEIQA